MCVGEMPDASALVMIALPLPVSSMEEGMETGEEVKTVPSI